MAVLDGEKLTEINRFLTEQTPKINRLTDRFYFSQFPNLTADLSRLKFSTSLFLPSFPLPSPRRGTPSLLLLLLPTTLLLIASRLETPETVRDSPDVQQRSSRKNDLFPNVKLVYIFFTFFLAKPAPFFWRGERHRSSHL